LLRARYGIVLLDSVTTKRFTQYDKSEESKVENPFC